MSAEIPFIKDEELEERAAQLREEYGFTAIPVDPIALADQMGLEVYTTERFDDPSVIGMIRRRAGKTELLVREESTVRRVSFTIAHEIGHYLLHFTDDRDGECVDGETNLYRHERGSAVNSERREVQANRFAAALLMPERDVRRVWATTRSIRALARLFCVSDAAMRYRIDQLGLW